MIVYSDELYHYGVPGMRWGTRRRARKDAKEFARAKMFYGEGAGTRRKLIKAKVNERSKDPFYKTEFDKAMSKQDMSKHASKAVSERHRKDTVKTVKQTGRGLVNIATGHPERVGAALATTAALYGVAHKTHVDTMIYNYAKRKVRDIRNSTGYQRGRSEVWKFVDGLKR